MTFFDELKNIPRDVIRDREQILFSNGFNNAASITVEILDNHITHLQENLTKLENQDLFLLQELIKLKKEIEDSYYKYFEG